MIIKTITKKHKTRKTIFCLILSLLNQTPVLRFELLTMSWKKVNLPPEYYPQSYTALAELPTPEEIEKETLMREGDGAYYVNKGCIVCHSISVFVIESAAKIGPELSNALEDVQSRFGKRRRKRLNLELSKFMLRSSTELIDV